MDLLAALVSFVMVFGDSLSSHQLAYYAADIEGVEYIKGTAQHGGWNSSDVLDPANSPGECGGLSPASCEFSKYECQAIVIAFGANEPPEHIIDGRFRQNLGVLVEMALLDGCPRSAIYLGNVQWNVYRDAPLSAEYPDLNQLVELNKIVADVAAHYGVNLVDYYGATAGADNHCVGPDQVHPESEYCWSLRNQAFSDALVP